ncbi:MAG: PQQ-binding-like beta-propeller repeat protein, partial [Pseudomonadota bacterium]
MRIAHKYWCVIFLCFALIGLALETHAVDGKAVYQQHCATCHETAEGRTPSRAKLEGLTTEAIVQALETGVMRVIGQWSLDGPKRVAVAEYLTGKSIDPSWASEKTLACTEPLKFADDPFAAPHWNGWGVDQENSRFQPERMARLSKEDVKKLELQWAYAFPAETVMEAPPSIIDGKMLIGSRSGKVHLLDAATGCNYWSFQADASIKNAIQIQTIGVDGRLVAFFGDISGMIYSVDAKTGRLIWKIRADTHAAARIVGGFQVHDGALYAPLSSLEEGMATDPAYQCCSFRGSVLKIDAETGRVIWQSYTIEEPAISQGP